MSEEPNGMVETKKRKTRRRSYVDECQAHERAKAIADGKLATALTILRNVKPEEGTEALLQTAVALIGEVIE